MSLLLTGTQEQHYKMVVFWKRCVPCTSLLSKLRRAHSVDWAVLVGGFGCAMAVNSSSVKANLFFESKHSGAVPVLFIFKMNIVFVWLERRTRCYSNSSRSLLRVAYNIAIG